MAVWEDFKAQGNEAFRSGNFIQAIQSYSMAIVLAGLDATSSELICILFSNRSAAFMKMESYQFARADAEDALTFMPTKKPHFT